MHKFAGYKCSLCNREYSAGREIYICPVDGGNLDVILDYQAIEKSINIDLLTSNREQSLWRYLPLLPLADPGGTGTPLRSTGCTPIYAPPGLRKKFGLRNLWIKDESRNPTASYKDRASAIVVSRAREIGAEIIVTASTGNAGAALAGMAAAVGQKAIIFAPKTAPPAKIAQLLVYGAQVILVDGSYDDAFDLTIKASKEYGWYCRNTGYNPFTVEGKKTASFELWEWSLANHYKSQFTDNQIAIFVSVGDGNIISGIHKGFKDLKQLGWIQDVPRIFGVQAEGSAAIANTFHRGDEVIIPVQANTLADSISVDLPRDGIRAVRAARETHGAYITVSDAEILEAIVELGNVGIFAEPAGATSFAGMLRAVQKGLVDPEETVIVINTGSGLKDIKAAMSAVHQAPIIEPSLDAVKGVIK